MKLGELFVILIIVILIIILIAYLTYKNNREANARKIMSKFPVSRSKPTFLRENSSRPLVMAPKVSETIELPKEFDSRKIWKGWINGTSDQGDCGACWSYSSSAVFSDRIRIASNGQDLAPNDFISPYHLAACMKCDKKKGLCNKVCEGHYLDDVLDFLVKNGCYSHHDINSTTDNGIKYICFHPENSDKARLFKGNSSYRVNPYSMSELNSSDKRETNAKAIMQEIYKKGPVTAVIKVFNPISPSDMHKNFYLYKKGVYGHNWGKKDPSAYDGYHAIGIVGWGVDTIDDQEVPYWIIRNSWGEEWGENGFGKVLRGSNLAVIESDIWTVSYDK